MTHHQIVAADIAANYINGNQKDAIKSLNNETDFDKADILRIIADGWGVGMAHKIAISYFLLNQKL